LFLRTTKKHQARRKNPDPEKANIFGTRHRRHRLTSILFVAAIASLVSACGTSNTGGGSTATPTATQTPTPSLSHLTVYATADTGYLRALQATSGQLRWQGQTGQLAGGQPVVENGIVYAGSSNTVYAFKASDGKSLWRFPTNGGMSFPSSLIVA
jgi:outer membrane protein assembly factor BamB